MAFLTSLYGFDREGKRITDEKNLRIEGLGDRYFVEDRNHKIF